MPEGWDAPDDVVRARAEAAGLDPKYVLRRGPRAQRKAGPRGYVSAYIAPGDHKWLLEAARREQRSLSELLREAIKLLRERYGG